MPEAIEHSERAYAGFRRRGGRRHAATAALWLAREHLNVGGRRAISNGWLNRAALSVELHPISLQVRKPGQRRTALSERMMKRRSRAAF